MHNIKRINYKIEQKTKKSAINLSPQIQEALKMNVQHFDDLIILNSLRKFISMSL